MLLLYTFQRQFFSYHFFFIQATLVCSETGLESPPFIPSVSLITCPFLNHCHTERGIIQCRNLQNCKTTSPYVSFNVKAFFSLCFFYLEKCSYFHFKILHSYIMGLLLFLNELNVLISDIVNTSRYNPPEQNPSFIIFKSGRGMSQDQEVLKLLVQWIRSQTPSRARIAEFKSHFYHLGAV